MDDKVIELKYSRTDFEEIYYRNGGDKTFLNHHLKKQRNTFIVIGAIFILTLIYIISINENFGFLIFAGIILCFAFYDWFIKAYPGIKWKKEIKIYLDGLDKIRENKLILTENAFSLIQDEKEIIEKWTEFRRTEMEENFISMISNTTTYLIPKKSMTPDEFQFLRTLLSEKVKNEL
jgi:hypothetical protein